jgi:MoaA/NifB/PqqE/SkfB family radical SAM enzyme
MKLSGYLCSVLPRAFNYHAARLGWVEPRNPLTLTFSVTAACQSRCLTCNIGRVYLENPKIADQNLSLPEIERVFSSLGPIFFLNISGGEPFMRPDLAEIIRLAALHLKPRLIHIPTNAYAPRFIEKTTRKILAHMETHLPRSVPLSIKPSIDGLGAMHDHIRGLPGNFRRLEQTLDILLAIRAEDPRLHVDLGTVISNHNIHHLEEIEDWVHARGVESYRHEIAEQRAEFHNLGDPITPSPEIYEQLTERFSEKIRGNIAGKSFLTYVTEAVRLSYYEVAVQILRQRRQVTPCLAGLSNIHLNYDGQVWPCCVLGGEHPLGHVRDCDYDLKALLRLPQADETRRYIADKNCVCPLANQWLMNVLLDPRHMMRVVKNTISLLVAGRKHTTARGGPLASDLHAAPDPQAVTVTVQGTRQGEALVLRKYGTIPDPEEAELPAYGAEQTTGSTTAPSPPSCDRPK